MENKPKRLKKHISFSKHEKDIYDYLEKQENASALIKRLVYNHMILEQNLITVPNTVKPSESLQTQEVQKAPQPKVSEPQKQEEPKVPEESKQKEKTPEPKTPEVQKDSNTMFTKEDLENQKILPEL